MKDYYKLALELHKKARGKIEISPKVPLNTQEDLSVSYTPGVAEPCRKIAENPLRAYEYTLKNNAIAVISDGSATLGLGNTGGIASLPVLEGKCVIFKKFANVDAFPIALKTQDPDEIIKTIVNISPAFGAINLEDIAAPKCFYIEEELKKKLDIPVVHDDQHCTAIVVLAGLINALKIVKKNFKKIKVVINGAGAAGTATAKLLKYYGFSNLILCDRQGVIYKGRKDLNTDKEKIAEVTNAKKEKGTLAKIIKNADVFIGLSAPKVLTKEMVEKMAKDPVVFALANPEPEIMPELALEAGAKIIATGRSDFPNQINNALIFPGFFRGLLDNRIKNVTFEMKIKAAEALASLIKIPTPKKFIPCIFDKDIILRVSKALS